MATKTNESKLQELREIASELENDLQQRIRTIDGLIRDANLGIDHLEEVQKLNLRMDRINLREKGREVTARLLELADSGKADQATVLRLRLVQTLLLSDIDVSKDSRLLDSLAKAQEKLVVEEAPEEDVKGKGF